MSLLRLDASIRTEQSRSRQLADFVEAEWRTGRAEDPVIRRDLVTDPVPADAWAAAVAASALKPADRSPAQQAALTLAGALVDELARATALVFAVPLYNFGVSQHFKTYVDLVLADPRMTNSGVTPATCGTPALLITVHGGLYTGGAARSGWDHSTSWMRHILVEAWGLDLLVLELDITLVGADVARDRCRPFAAKLADWASGAPRMRDRALDGGAAPSVDLRRRGGLAR